MTGASTAQMKMWVDGLLGTNVQRVTEHDNGYQVHCRDQAQQVQVLSLHGRVLTTGQLLSATAQEAELTFEEMRQICRQTLQPRENAQEIKAAAGSAPPPPRNAQRQSQVAMVEAPGGATSAATDDGNDEDINTESSVQDLPSAEVNAAKGNPKRGKGKGKPQIAAVAPPSSDAKAKETENASPKPDSASNPPLPQLLSPFMSQVMPPRIRISLVRANLGKINGMVVGGEAGEGARERGKAISSKTTPGMAMVVHGMTKTVLKISHGSKTTGIRTQIGSQTTRISHGSLTTTQIKLGNPAPLISHGNPTTTPTKLGSLTPTRIKLGSLTPTQISPMVYLMTQVEARVGGGMAMEGNPKARVGQRAVVQPNQPGNRGAKGCAGGPSTPLAAITKPSTGLIQGLEE